MYIWRDFIFYGVELHVDLLTRPDFKEDDELDELVFLQFVKVQTLEGTIVSGEVFDILVGEFVDFRVGLLGEGQIADKLAFWVNKKVP